MQAHSKVSQGSWAGSSLCLCGGEEIHLPELMRFPRCAWTGRKEVLFSYVEGNPVVSDLHLQGHYGSKGGTQAAALSSFAGQLRLERRRGEGKEGGGGIP